MIEFLEHRRSIPALQLAAPGPDDAAIARLLAVAARVPDHGKLTPWRFLIIEGQAKTAFETKLADIAERRRDTAKCIAGLKKLARPPLCIAVISQVKEAPIPEWEQVLSAGAVCMNLLTASLVMGFGANWLTGWYAYDKEAVRLLGLVPGERVAGMVMIGTPVSKQDDRARPDLADLVTRLAT